MRWWQTSSCSRSMGSSSAGGYEPAGFCGPMVLYSAHINAEVRMRALRTGVHAVVPKDTAGEALVTLLSSLSELLESSPGVEMRSRPAAHLVELLDLSRYEALLVSELTRTRRPVPACVLMDGCGDAERVATCSMLL